ncbi:hypothetical protein GCM10010320_59330 [Streptomyces caelestis]|nr:hypothetical protein GCM10010320_59330 [Streptomyces caelestis]
MLLVQVVPAVRPVAPAGANPATLPARAQVSGSRFKSVTDAQSHRAGGRMVVTEVTGTHTYRSFLNKPELVEDFDKLRFAELEFETCC